MNWPTIAPEEKQARAGNVAAMFETLGVKASEARTKGFLNATCWIPWPLFRDSIAEAISTWSATDKFTQAPQPGDILKLALARAPRGEWDAIAGWAEPEWARLTRFAQHQIAMDEFADRRPKKIPKSTGMKNVDDLIEAGVLHHVSGPNPT